MFGYVRVAKPEMKVKEYELYRACYCGLCHSMGKCTGQCSRMALSYDFAFLALTRMTFVDSEIALGKKRCVAHPLHKKSYIKSNPALEYSAGAAAILNYHKVLDDLSDEKGAKKLRALLIRPFVAHSRKKALKKLSLSELDQRVASGLTALSALEKEGLPSVNEPAGLFGEILGEIMSYGLPEPERRIAYALGVAVGKWIYITDALDDWREDAKNGRYNPFILLYGREAPTDEQLEGIKIALKNELFAAEGALDLMEFKDEGIKNIIFNILYIGLPEKAESLGKKPIDKKDRNAQKASKGNNT